MPRNNTLYCPVLYYTILSCPASSEHGGLLQGHAVILKSEMHDLSGSKAFSFDAAFDDVSELVSE